MINNKIPSDKLNEMAVFFTKLNFGLKVGNFEMNMETGEIHFKTYVEIINEDDGEKGLERAIMLNIITLDHYLSDIMKAIYSTNNSPL